MDYRSNAQRKAEDLADNDAPEKRPVGIARTVRRVFDGPTMIVETVSLVQLGTWGRQPTILKTKVVDEIEGDRDDFDHMAGDDVDAEIFAGGQRRTTRGKRRARNDDFWF